MCFAAMKKTPPLWAQAQGDLVACFTLPDSKDHRTLKVRKERKNTDSQKGREIF